MRNLAALISIIVSVFLTACSTQSAKDAGCQGPLFGRPAAQTGLGADACQPACLCGATPFQSPEFSAGRLAELRAWVLETPFAEVKDNPYSADAGVSTAGVCAVVVTDSAAHRYRVQTFADVAAAASAGAYLTHHSPCGVCSTLKDLALYAENTDLGAPVRQCGVDSFGKGFDANVACLEGLGFTRPCAQVWAWNTVNTRNKCLGPCLENGDKPYHLADGGLNGCLACDERESGPTFKQVAGRTRRNTGIASAICRPCQESAPVAHDYPSF